MSIFLIIILTVLFGVSKSICDTSECCFKNSKLSKFNPNFWDKHKSWVNKWKNNDPINGEKFIGSSTVFVWVTDAWHIFNMLSYLSIFLIGIIISDITDNIYYITIPYLMCFVIFELSYRFLNKKKTNKKL